MIQHKGIPLNPPYQGDKSGDYAMIEYRGYIGAIDFDPEIDLFHGTVINTNDVISFYGASVNELCEEMQKSVEGYLEFCKEQGKTSEKPYNQSRREQIWANGQ